MANPIPLTTVITGVLAGAQVPLTVLVSYLRSMPWSHLPVVWKRPTR
jgi:hypothetical protein